jgi:cellulose synthase (UDP-forming)
MPNIAVIVISLAAIVYGLYNDWNPFTLFMAGIASLNCLFMAFMLMASSELKFKEYSKNHYVVSSTYNYVKFFKRRFWLLRRQIYAGIRRVSLTVTILVICTCIYIAKRSDENTVQVSATPPGVKISKSSPSDGNTLLNYIHSNKAEVLRVMGQQNSKPVNDVDTLAADNINVDSLIQVNTAARTPKYYPETKGVIYTKGQFWFKNLFPLNKQTIERDFDEMKVVGVNTVKIYGPNIYDHITFDVARQKGIKIDYSFWIPYPSAFIYDTSVLNDLEKTIINTVKDNKGNKAIHAWNIGNNALQELTDYYAASQLPYAQYNYIQWVKKLVKSIKAADSSRPVTIDLTAGPTVDESMALMHAQVPELDAFGLIVGDRAALTKVTTNLKAPYFYSSLNPKAMQSLPLPAGGVFYANWQDQKTASIVTFDGLKDIWGRNKPYLGLISASWHGGVAYKALPPVKILRPALTAIGGNSLPYNAMVYSGDKWNLAVDSARNMTFEWYLVRTNGWGKPVDIQEVGKGPRVYVTIPWDMQSYRLYLIAAKGKEIVDASSILNIPLNDDIKAGKKSEK